MFITLYDVDLARPYFEIDFEDYGIVIRLFYRYLTLAGYELRFYITRTSFRTDCRDCVRFRTSTTSHIFLERPHFLNINVASLILPYQLARFIYIVPHIERPEISLNDGVLMAMIHHKMDLDYFIRIMDGES